MFFLQNSSSSSTTLSSLKLIIWGYFNGWFYLLVIVFYDGDDSNDDDDDDDDEDDGSDDGDNDDDNDNGNTDYYDNPDKTCLERELSFLHSPTSFILFHPSNNKYEYNLNCIAPGPVGHFQLTVTSSDTITASWSIPEETRGDIVHYSIKVFEKVDGVVSDTAHWDDTTQNTVSQVLTQFRLLIYFW